MADGTYVEIKGKFSFAINQNGLDYDNEEERQQAIDDFWDCWEEFKETYQHHPHHPHFEFDEKDLLVEEGE